MTSPKPSFTLAPSHFAYLYAECPRCYALHVVHKDYRPFAPFPSVFGKIDGANKAFFGSQRTEDVLPALPPGLIVTPGRQKLTSHPFELEDATVQLSGYLDAYVEFDDGTLGVVDFKTTSSAVGQDEKYSRQLHSYAHALEAKTGKTVSHMGLFVLSPIELRGSSLKPGAGWGLWMDGAYVPVERDDVAFKAFLGQVATLLAGPLPDPALTCGYCDYRTRPLPVPERGAFTRALRSGCHVGLASLGQDGFNAGLNSGGVTPTWLAEGQGPTPEAALAELQAKYNLMPHEDDA